MKHAEIACICLDPGGRPDFRDRTLRCILAQTLHHAVPICGDTSTPGRTVGAWRNTILSDIFQQAPEIDYVAHFDWDDVSAPDRLSIQLAHIQKTGKLVTGFYEMPLYDAVNDKVWIYSHEKKQNFALGTSLFYKREAWERVKFPEDRVVDDNLWRQKIGGENIDSISGFRADGSPIMIQVVHGGNASARIVPSSKKFKEASEAQARAVREILARA